MDGEIACQSCDLLVNVAATRHGESASCPRCGCFLTKLHDDALHRVIAFSSIGLMFLAFASSYPFLSLSSSGVESAITLIQAPFALWSKGMPEVAVLVTAFIIAIPALVLMMMLTLCILITRGRYHSSLLPLAKGIFIGQKWSMVEVFLIAVIVAMVKIAAMATVTIGISFWAYGAFAICFTLAASSLDRYQCWQKIALLAIK
ncbi:MAG: paraquat-inducible protein A [Halioglobus sp.]|nr:paraquat-inducible protein A [Halioglobus sp.]